MAGTQFGVLADGGSPALPPPTGTIRAVVFDLEGVLIETRAWRREALDRVLRLHGIALPLIDPAGPLDNLPITAKLHRVSDASGLPRALHGEVATLERHFMRRLVEQCCHPDQTRLALLYGLMRHGLSLGAVAGTDRDLAQALCVRSGLCSLLDVVVTDSDAPGGASHAIAASRLGIPPDHLLAVTAAPVPADARAPGCTVLSTTTLPSLAMIEAHLALA